MIVVVEGIDRVGKTTLCNKLKEIGCKVFKDSLADCLAKYTNEEKSLMATSSMNTLVNFAKLFQDEVIVLDRFHATELVYGAVERGDYSSNAIKRFFDIELTLEELGNDYLYVYVEPTNLDWSTKQHGKDLGKHLYWFELIYKSINQKNTIKVNFNTLDEVAIKIKNLKEEQQ